MGRTHLDAIRRLGFVDVAAVVGSSREKARAFADTAGIDVATDDYKAIVGDPDIQAVHVCTPNAQHFAMASAALDRGKHVMCEKPLASTKAEAATLVAMAAATSVRNATCYNLRYYPMVQQMRRMREAGQFGDILIAQGTYSQDWLLYETDWNWRVDASQAGSSRVLGDIGSHWCDMVEHVTGLQITSLCADLATFHKTRQRSGAAAQKSRDAFDVAVDTEDFGAVMFRLGARARGVFTASQVSAGRKNRLNIEIYGTKGSASWDQERPDELWLGRRDGPSELLVKDPLLLMPGASAYADLPGGHSEGYADTFKQLFKRFYGSILDRSCAPEYPQFTDGLRQMRLLEAAMISHERRAWVEVLGD
jgi:predicted dehydrogenase